MPTIHWTRAKKVGVAVAAALGLMASLVTVLAWAGVNGPWAASDVQTAPTSSASVEGPPPRVNPGDEGIPSIRLDPGSAHDVTTFASRAFLEDLNASDITKYKSEEDLRNLAHMEYWSSGDSVNAGTTRMKFTLVGQHRNAVYLTKISARVVERLTPPSGTLVYLQPEGASDNPQIFFDLDRDVPEAFAIDEGGSPTSELFLNSQQVAIEFGEPVTFLVRAVSASCYCKFVIFVEASDGTQLQIGHGDDPWSVSAFAATYRNSYLVATKYRGVPTPCPWPSMGTNDPMNC
jgi:hypothetical protein